MKIRGTFATHSGVYNGEVEYSTETGKIIKVIQEKEVDWEYQEWEAQSPEIQEDSMHFPANFLIFPGFLDIHTHCREDISGSQNHKEDFHSAGSAAIHGGVTGLMDMPNNPIPPCNTQSLAEKQALTKKAGIPVILFALLDTRTPLLPDTIPLKFYKGTSVNIKDNERKEDYSSLFSNRFGTFISMHLENVHVLRKNSNKATHEERRPAEAEIVDLEEAINLAAKYGFHLNACHLSTAKSMELIQQARSNEISISCEVSFHHLIWDTQNKKYNHRPELLIMNPPLRTPEDRQAMVEALINGQIDYIASDHAPHTLTEKDDFIPGIPHLDTFSPATALLMKDYGVIPQMIAATCSYYPGKLFQRFANQKVGEIDEGFDASFTILDLGKPWKVHHRDLFTKCEWSPFENQTLPASNYMTIVKGEILYQG